MSTFYQMKTKTTKQCIEFYYFWKKVMSDNMKKKWRSIKKNRLAETTSIHQNLRSSKNEVSSGVDKTNKSEFKDKTNNFKIDSTKSGIKRNKVKCPQCSVVS